MKKFFGIIALSIIAGLTIASCDLDSFSLVGTGNYEYKFVNRSSYDITVSDAEASIFSTFTVKSGKTTTLRSDDWNIKFDYSNRDKVDVFTSGWGSSESRVVFRNK